MDYALVALGFVIFAGIVYFLSNKSKKGTTGPGKGKDSTNVTEK